MTELPRLLDAQVPWARIDKSERKEVDCLLCGSYAPKPIASIVINQEEFFLVRCEEDSLIWLNPQPGFTFLSRLYAEQYYAVARYAPELVH